jgi:hypothetical protein
VKEVKLGVAGEGAEVVCGEASHGGIADVLVLEVSLLHDLSDPRVNWESFIFAHRVKQDAVGDLRADAGKSYEFRSRVKIGKAGDVREEAWGTGDLSGSLANIGVPIAEVAELLEAIRRGFREGRGAGESVVAGGAAYFMAKSAAEALDATFYSDDIVVRGNDEGDEGLPGVLAQHPHSREISHGGSQKWVFRKGAQGPIRRGIQTEVSPQL